MGEYNWLSLCRIVTGRSNGVTDGVVKVCPEVLSWFDSRLTAGRDDLLLLLVSEYEVYKHTQGIVKS